MGSNGRRRTEKKARRAESAEQEYPRKDVIVIPETAAASGAAPREDSEG
jgi:apolipoprotein N-acyltransferase